MCIKGIPVYMVVVTITYCALAGHPPLHEGGYNSLQLTTCYEQWGSLRDVLVSEVLES